jgi:hypothetical protein
MIAANDLKSGVSSTCPKTNSGKRYSTDAEFKQRHPEIHVEEDPYNHPGFGHCCLNADDLESLRQLLTDEAVLSASAALNLKLMQRRPTIYSQFHNPALARLMCSHMRLGKASPKVQGYYANPSIRLKESPACVPARQSHRTVVVGQHHDLLQQRRCDQQTEQFKVQCSSRDRRLSAPIPYVRRDYFPQLVYAPASDGEARRSQLLRSHFAGR